MEMTWKQANDWVSQHDGEKPDEDNHVDRLARIAAAAEELGYDVDGSEYDEQESVIALYMGGSVRHEFYDKGCVDAAITFCGQSFSMSHSMFLMMRLIGVHRGYQRCAYGKATRYKPPAR